MQQHERSQERVNRRAHDRESSRSPLPVKVLPVVGCLCCALPIVLLVTTFGSIAAGYEVFQYFTL
jgi:hypothetical protein